MLNKLAQTAAYLKATTTPLRVAQVGTVVIGAGAFWLSFAALTDLARKSGVPGYQAWVWPVIVDGLILVASVAVVALKGSGAANYAWALFTAGAVVSVAANAAHAWPHGFIASCVAAAPPLTLLAVTELVVKLRKRAAELATNLEAEAEAWANAEAERHAAELADRQAWEAQARAEWAAETDRQLTAQAQALEAEAEANVEALRDEWEQERANVTDMRPRGKEAVHVHEIACNLILAGHSPQEAAQKMGVSVRSITNWTSELRNVI
ncbi:DUF2637 domain-containing protein [Nocardiaceae bacterium NPDC056970]